MPDSSLRCLDVRHGDLIDSGYISLPEFQSLITAVSKSIRLERLAIQRFEVHPSGGNIEVLFDAIPSFKIKELAIEFTHEPDEEDEDDLLLALEENYIVQEVKCNWNLLGRQEFNFFNERNQARLEFFLNRNRRLAQ